MSKKTEYSDELKLLLTTARMLQHHLANHAGRLKTMDGDAAELAGMLKPYNDAEAAEAEAAAKKEARAHG